MVKNCADVVIVNLPSLFVKKDKMTANKSSLGILKTYLICSFDLSLRNKNKAQLPGLLIVERKSRDATRCSDNVNHVHRS